MKEKYPLQWPQGWPRTPLKERETKTAWKKPEREAIERLETELRRFQVLSFIVTRKNPTDFRTAPDPSVAVWFSRKHDDDFSWQSALQIENPAPTVEEIEIAFRRLALQHHPDKGGDYETWIVLQRHKKAALAYVDRLSDVDHEYCIACDKYNEVRWNITAITNTVHSWRQMERDGTSRLLERSMEGFRALPEGSTDATPATSH